MKEANLEIKTLEKVEEKKKLKYTLLTILAGAIILFFGFLIIFNIHTTNTIIQKLLSDKDYVVEQMIHRCVPGVFIPIAD